MTSKLLKPFRAVQRKMWYPSLDHLNLSQLENRSATLATIEIAMVVFGAIIVFASVFFGLWYQGYQKRVDARIVEIKTANDVAHDESLKQIVQDTADRVKAKIPNVTGIIAPGNSETPVFAGIESVPESAVVFLIGNNVWWTDRFPCHALYQGEDNLITIDKETGNLLVNALFFNENGKIICEIFRNEFHLNPGTYFRMESQPHQLKVINDEANVALDVEYINNRCVRINGDFHLRNRQRVKITNKGINFGNNINISGNVHGGVPARGALEITEGSFGM